MSNLLVRGLPKGIHRQMRKIAREENLSMNQIYIQAAIFFMRKFREEREKEERRQEAFRRIDELRERIYKRYGKMDESWKLIREMREERIRKLQ